MANVLKSHLPIKAEQFNNMFRWLSLDDQFNFVADSKREILLDLNNVKTSCKIFNL